VINHVTPGDTNDDPMDCGRGGKHIPRGYGYPSSYRAVSKQIPTERKYSGIMNSTVT